MKGGRWAGELQGLQEKQKDPKRGGGRRDDGKGRGIATGGGGEEGGEGEEGERDGKQGTQRVK